MTPCFGRISPELLKSGIERARGELVVCDEIDLCDLVFYDQVVPMLLRHEADLIVGAGTVWSVEIAARCLDAGAKFLTSTGLDLEVVEFADRAQAVSTAAADVIQVTVDGLTAGALMATEGHSKD